MTVPHDERAPHRQQRWVECKNVDSTALDPFSVVEVVDTINPDTGRTVFEVRIPTCDSAENTVVLGQMTIQSGEFGYCTNDFPAYVKYSGSAPTVGEVWGVQSGLTAIVADQIGFLILGDVDATNHTVRVRRIASNVQFFKVKATTCHNPGDTDTMDLWTLDGATNTWVDTGTTVTVYDPEYRAMLVPGEFGWVAKFTLPNCQERYEFIAEQGLHRLATADGAIACNSSGTATIYYHDSVGSCTPAASTCSVSVCNEWGYTRRIASGEEIHIRFHELRWDVIPTPRTQKIRATLGADLCPTDASATISGSYTYMDYCSTEEPTSAVNDLGLSGISGDVVDIVYNQASDQWHVDNVEHHEHTILVDSMLRISSGPSSCILQGYELRYTSIMSCDTPAWEDEISFTSVSVLQDVDINGLCFEGTVTTVWVPCSGTPSQVELFCGIDCSAGS